MTEISKNQKGIEQNVLGLPVDRNIIFSNHKGAYKHGTEKRQTKLFQKISFIKPFLKEGARILLVTTGCSTMSIMEQFLTGWIVFALPNLSGFFCKGNVNRSLQAKGGK